MSYRGLNVLAVVPARGGSKGIPRKNLREVAGISLVGHAARVAKALDWLDAAVLSTDDDEIAAEARRHGLAVPFMRPDAIAGDAASSVDMWVHAWLASEEACGKRFDVSVLLEPTSPLRRPEDVARTLDALLGGDHAIAATVSRAPAHFTPQKCLTVTDGMIEFYHAQGQQFATRQAIPAYYFRNGVCYAARRATIVDERRILGPRSAAVVMERPLVNIDEPLDLEIAELLMRRQAAGSSA